MLLRRFCLGLKLRSISASTTSREASVIILSSSLSCPTIPVTPWQALSSFISPIDGKYLSNDNNKIGPHGGRCPPLHLHQCLRSLKVLDPWQIAPVFPPLSHDFHSDLAGVVHLTEVTILVLDLVSFIVGIYSSPCLYSVPGHICQGC